tara:strand:- start:249 stop:620 length:372 start_codon:yes stop_codon:yes gene_type:complete
MTIKLLLLKSGEDLIADVQEMVVKENVVGYFLNKPCVVKMRDHKEVVDEEVTEEKQKSQFQVKFYPWIPLAKDSVIPLTIDWVVTMVDPVDNLTKMYNKQVLENGQSNQSNGTDEQGSSGESD